MTPRFSLIAKVLLLSFLNLALLVLAVAVIIRAQFRLDPGSFLLSPAQNRILAVAQSVAFEMDEADPAGWDEVLARAAANYGVMFFLFDQGGEQIAGEEIPLPREVGDRIPRRRRPPEDPPREPERKAGLSPRPLGPPLFYTATSDPTRYWVGVRVPVREDRAENPRPGTLVLMSPSLLGSGLFFDIGPFFTIGLAVILISVLCWLPFIRGLTRSIAHLTRATGQIAAGRFDIQVPDRRRDELGQLGDSINRMAARLSSFVTGQKQFLSAIAHELCNPIATMRFGLSNLERRTDEGCRPTVEEIQEEVQHMSMLVNELLSFTRGGMDALDIQLAPVELEPLLARVLEREASPPAAITTQVPPGLAVLADADSLFRALSNVVRNAIRYAGQAGPIHIAARTESGAVCLTVSDNGPGVPESSLEEIFAPFYRLDPARAQDTGGLGLGLAIVRNCVEACNGSVRCRNRQPRGLEVEIRLPQAVL